MIEVAFHSGAVTFFFSEVGLLHTWCFKLMRLLIFNNLCLKKGWLCLIWCGEGWRGVKDGIKLSFIEKVLNSIWKYSLSNGSSACMFVLKLNLWSIYTLKKRCKQKQTKKTTELIPHFKKKAHHYILITNALVSYHLI